MSPGCAGMRLGAHARCGPGRAQGGATTPAAELAGALAQAQGAALRRSTYMSHTRLRVV